MKALLTHISRLGSSKEVTIPGTTVKVRMRSLIFSTAYPRLSSRTTVTPTFGLKTKCGTAEMNAYDPNIMRLQIQVNQK